MTWKFSMQISGASGSEPAVHELIRFGKYHLLASLGQGGMAKVYLALLAGPSDFKKLLVIKIMKPDALGGADDGTRMFWAEARLAARLLHPNIVHTYEVGEHEGRCFMAMEYLDGQPLSAVLNRARADRDLPLAELVRVLSEIARGLHYAHQLKGFQNEDLHVVHRDVSPQNLIVTYEGHGKLVDFGIAKTSDGEQTQLGLVKGKLDYIAPEQLRGEPVDARADVFALGAILWEVVSGHRFAGGRKQSDVQKVQARLSAGERKLRALKPDAPAELEAIIARATALRKGDRYADAAAFADALDGYLERENLRPNARVLSARLSALFASERADMNALIERQLTLLKDQPIPEGEEHAPVSTTGARKLQSGFGLFVADSHQEERSAIRNATGVRASTVAPPRNHAGIVIGVLAAALAAAAFAFLWLSGRADRELAARDRQTQERTLGALSAQQAKQAADLALARQAPQNARPALRDEASVIITLQVTPSDALVRLDGVRVQLPFEGSFRRDSTLHRIEASAPGYRAVKEFVAFDRERKLALALVPLQARRGARLDQLVERASSAVEQQPEPAVVRAPAGNPPPPAARDQPVLERPNPYAGE